MALNHVESIEFKFDNESKGVHFTVAFNSLSSGDAYMRRLPGSSLEQIMACRLLGAKSLPTPVLTYCLGNHTEHILTEFCLKFKRFH